MLGLRAAPGNRQQLQLVWENDFETASLASLVVLAVWYMYDDVGSLRVWLSTNSSTQSVLGGGGGLCQVFGGGGGAVPVLGPADIFEYFCYFRCVVYASM